MRSRKNPSSRLETERDASTRTKEGAVTCELIGTSLKSQTATTTRKIIATAAAYHRRRHVDPLRRPPHRVLPKKSFNCTPMRRCCSTPCFHGRCLSRKGCCSRHYRLAFYRKVLRSAQQEEGEKKRRAKMIIERTAISLPTRAVEHCRKQR